MVVAVSGSPMTTSPVDEGLRTGIRLTLILHGADILIIALIAGERGARAGTIGGIALLAGANLSIVASDGSARETQAGAIATLIAVALIHIFAR